MNDKLILELMRTEHIARVAQIERETFSMPWSEQGFADALSMEQAIFYVAISAGKVAGYCGIYLAADEGELTNIAVAAPYRRKKIARALLDKTLREVRENGVKRVYLEVRQSNVPAIRLYESAGFYVVGNRKGFYQLPTEDALVMLCEIADKYRK